MDTVTVTITVAVRPAPVTVVSADRLEEQGKQAPSLGLLGDG